MPSLLPERLSYSDLRLPKTMVRMQNGGMVHRFRSRGSCLWRMVGGGLRAMTGRVSGKITMKEKSHSFQFFVTFNDSWHSWTRRSAHTEAPTPWQHMIRYEEWAIQIPRWLIFSSPGMSLLS